MHHEVVAGAALGLGPRGCASHKAFPRLAAVQNDFTSLHEALNYDYDSTVPRQPCPRRRLHDHTGRVSAYGQR
eukprot:1897361-Prymnesium_polylepis.1